MLAYHFVRNLSRKVKRNLSKAAYDVENTNTHIQSGRIEGKRVRK